MFTAPLNIVCVRGFPGVLTSQFLYINVCLDWAATTEFNITEKSPLVGFFIPAGTSIPEHTSLCCWFSTDLAPTATYERTSERYQ